MKALSVIVIGAGGHGRVVADALQAAGRKVIGFCDDDAALHGTIILGLPVLGSDACLRDHSADAVELANGVGSARDIRNRALVFDRLREKGYRFCSVVHPSATVSAYAKVAAGAQLMAGCVVQVNARIGENAIINTSASVDHDCVIGDNVHIAPGATLSGAVEVGEGTHVGTGVRVIQGMRIGRYCVIGAGAVVLRDVPDGSVAIGVPARARKGA
jgi:UDP-perosamine 4-acetyltransferase